MPKSGKIVKAKQLLHPNSRKALKLAKQEHHQERIAKRLSEKSRRLEVLGEKIVWFQENCDSEKACYTKEEASTLVEEYLGRYDDELEQIELRTSIGQRKGNQHASRLMHIQHVKKTERAEFESAGFEIPDLLNVKQLQALREWSGELRYIQNLRLRRVKPCTASCEASGTDLSQDADPEYSVSPADACPVDPVSPADSPTRTGAAMEH